MIEDEPGLRAGVSAALRATGFATDAAGDLAGGNKLLASHRYDCMARLSFEPPA